MDDDAMIKIWNVPPGVYAPIAEYFIRAREMHIQKSREYKDSVGKFGNVMQAMFPAGLQIHPQDFDKMGVFFMMVGKMVRFAENVQNGHQDSLRDLAVYALMLEHLYDKEGELQARLDDGEDPPDDRQYEMAFTRPQE